ncbi:hypothetical protein TI05_05670 [Achromatium sp. WMS3]|nr:hypothetical protein TI05_05670 [Achromatium sp. WMS3]
MPKLQWLRTARQMRSTMVWRTRIVFWGGSILVGIIATILAWSSDTAGLIFHQFAKDSFWFPLLVTPLGLIFLAWLTNNFFPAAEGSGIPQAIAMIQISERTIRHNVLSLKIALGKGIMVILGLLFGASIGREGPTVHIAAAICYSLPRFARFPHHAELRGLILAGGAAGIAAAFNTPLAGIVFAIEEMRRGFDESTSATVLTAVIIAGMVALVLQGNYRYFGSVQATLDIPEMIVAVLICGIVGGIFGGLFSRFLVHGVEWFAPIKTSYPYMFAGFCGLTLAILGIATDGFTFGTGYEQAKHVIDGAVDSVHTHPIYPLSKLFATLVSYWSGIPGGIFAPTLSVGANLGAQVATWISSEQTTAIALLGMVGYFTGVVQSPLTAVVIVMELTNQSSMLLPLMGTALIAEWVASHFCKRPLYRVLADAYMKPIPATKHRN